MPPLDYDRVRRLKTAHPDLTIVLNGGITTLDQARQHLEWAGGVMLGRAAYQNPYLLAEVDHQIFGEDTPVPSREEVLEALIPYAGRHVSGGGRLNNITRHILGLYHGRPRGRAFRRHLSEHAVRSGAGADVLEAALEIARGNIRPEPRASAA